MMIKVNKDQHQVDENANERVELKKFIKYETEKIFSLDKIT